MCGIAGIVGQLGVPDRRAALDRMHAAIAHRGPDDSGAWCAPSGAMFAHSRLSIIDPSPGGHQPMSIGDGRLTITYNGEIYNYAELRRTLQQSGVVFRSTSDTEVILRLFEAMGPRCVEQLRGMFAFAIWDEPARTCFLARDRFGIKPLFYHERSEALVFASEVRALIASHAVPVDIDPQAAYEYFCSGSIPEPLTLVKQVRALEAGHCLVWRDGRTTVTRYWDIEFPSSEPVDDAALRTREALIDSIQHHFVSDVPVGVFLSGGVDSTAIVALASVARKERLHTFSLTLPGNAMDEGPAARRTAQHFGTDHHEWAVDGAFARSVFDDFLAAADQPSIDGFNTYLVCRLAREHQTKVVLSGLGGDELFGGYPSFDGVPRLLQWGKMLRKLGAAAGPALGIAAAFGGSRLRRLEDFSGAAPTLDTAYAIYRGIFTRREALALTGHFVSKEAVVTAAERQRADAPTAADSISRFELTRYMRNQLLRDSDVMSMASGIELRVPFLDSAVFATICRIPAGQRLATGKQLLKDAVPEIPEWVLNQPKRGFMFPFKEWITTSLADKFARVDRHSPVPTYTWYRKWAIVAFERWLETAGASANGVGDIGRRRIG